MNLTENANILLEKRYLYKHESPEQLFERVAKNIASCEHDKSDYWAEEFYNLMANLDFLPNSPTLMNAGRPLQSLSACFVLPVEDSIEGIFDAIKHAALVSKSGGGCGFSFSNIRPANDIVLNSTGVASGPVSFMKVFNSATEVIKQGSFRRGANMGVLRVDHPDILDFIACKKNHNDLTSFNISVGITDEFMQALKENKTYKIINPRTKEYIASISAVKVFQEICKNAWESGEPGLVFLDEINRFNYNKHIGEIESTNPCLHKDTRLLTNQGSVKISEIGAYTNIKVWNGNSYNSVSAWRNGIKKVYKITTKSGYSYKTTAEHRFILADGSICEAKNLIGKRIKFDFAEKDWDGYNPFPDIDYEILGFEFGDGGYHKKSKRMEYIYCTPEKDKEIIAKIESLFSDKFKPKTKSNPTIHYVINIPYRSVYANAFIGKIENRNIPDFIFALPKKQLRDFIRGLFSANGCNLIQHHRVNIVSINKKMLEDLQELLLLFGIKCRLREHSPNKSIKFQNGYYNCKQSWNLIISRKSYINFMRYIGFTQAYKNIYNVSIAYKDELPYETVVSIEELGESEVWDFNEVSDDHCGYTNGAIVKNCGEQPILPNSSCNLGSINLTHIVENKAIDLEKLKVIIKKAVRFLDDVITVNKFPLIQIKQITDRLRPIGLGVMGFADMLFMLGIPYNSEQAYTIAENIMSVIHSSGVEASQELAITKGSFPDWRKSTLKNIYEKPLRNSTITTVAPTGSISIIAGCSSGIEPIFALAFEKHVLGGTILKELNPYFLQTAIDNQFYSDALIDEILKVGSIQHIQTISEEIRKIYVTALDIDYKDHVRMQSIFQKYSDSGVSKTINLKESATIEDVSNAFLLAYESKCKGITVYRNNSRKEQVLNLKKKEEKILKPRIRPNTTHGDTTKVKTGCGNCYITINEDKDGLCEVFIKMGKSGGCQSSFTEVIGRLISLSLRAGLDIESIIKQLNNIHCPEPIWQDQKVITSCVDAIGKALKSYIEAKGIKVKEDEYTGDNPTCPECGYKLIHEGGCVHCSNCNYSKCG